jgi:hypothetical protein
LSVGVPRYREAHLVRVFPSRLGASDWWPGALLVSPFNMKWRLSAPAGGVEGSKLCLFSVIMPAKCGSGVSPRFHCRRLAFCFLPLAAILEYSIFLFSQTIGSSTERPCLFSPPLYPKLPVSRPQPIISPQQNPSG